MSNAATVEALFFAALEKEDVTERTVYLDSACGGDAGLRRQVEKLLKAHPRVGEFLQRTVAEQFDAGPEAPDATQAIDASTEGRRLESTDRKDPSLARTEAEGSRDGHTIDLDFLQNSARPDSLGRLGHYEVLQVLGQGGFGIVLRAFDEQLQRVVAIKVLDPQLAVTSPARKRFLREARSSAKVRHENVVQVYAVEEEPLPYLVMEFVPGGTLQERLDRTGPLAATEVVRIGQQIAEGLAAAHGTGLIHRDIKPANILIEAGPNQHVKITDFGLARAADDASLSQSGLIAGTPMFMAPEQAQGDALDHRADLFSLGSVLYAICSGRPPFRANSTLAVLKRVAEDTPRPISEIIPEAPPWLCEIIARLHAKKPEDRFATAREVADLLGRGLAALQHPANVQAPRIVARATAEKTRQAREIPEASPANRRPRFRARRWAAAAAVLMLVLGGLGFTEATGVTDFHGTVIRLFSPDGTLEIQVDDPAVSVQIDGKDVVITGAGAKEIRLKPGNYTIEASKDGKPVRPPEVVTVTRDGKQVVRVSREGPPSDVTAGANTSPTDFANTLGMKFKLIPAGKFTMGSSPQEIERCLKLAGDDPFMKERLPTEGPEHEVEITRPFYMGATEVTVGPFRQFIEANPKYNVGDDRWKAPGPNQTDDHPVVWVSWDNAVAFCNWLSEKEGRKYRLPTEAEWEYCCRAGKAGARYCYGDEDAQLENYGWYGKDEDAGTQPVGKKKPNDWGLYDMHGNAWEWCKDYYDASYYQNSPAKDPTGPGVDVDRVCRGGSVDVALPAYCRSTYRNHVLPAFRNSNLGFRVLLVSPPGGVRIESGAKDKGIVAQSTDSDRKAAEYVLSIGGTVKVNGRDQEIKAAADLPRESFRLSGVELARNKQATDAGLALFKDCNNLTALSLWQTNIGDNGLVHIKECKAITHLWLGTTRVTDAGLAQLDGRTNLVLLDLLNTDVTDAGVSHLRDCRELDNLSLTATRVTDPGLAPLKDCKNLRSLYLDKTNVTDAGMGQLAGLSKLTFLGLVKTQVTAQGVAELAKALPQCKIQWDGAIEANTASDNPLPAATAEQVEHVRKEMKRRNPGFDGALTPAIENDAVVGLTFTTDHVTDISPLQALNRLKRLKMRGSAHRQGSLADLTPLHGTPLTDLDVTDNGAIKDLSALKGMPLKNLNITQTGVTDLTPLQGMPLEWLMVWNCHISDLTPLQGMPLKWLNCGGSDVKLDLTPLAGLPLDFLCVNLTQVSDLRPLKDVPLTTLLCSNTPVSDLAPLHGMRLVHLQVFKTKVSDLSPLKGMPLTELECQEAAATDLSPLNDLPLRTLTCDFQPERDAKILRAIKTLETINAKPAAQFWKEVGGK